MLWYGTNTYNSREMMPGPINFKGTEDVCSQDLWTLEELSIDVEQVP